MGHLTHKCDRVSPEASEPAPALRFTPAVEGLDAFWANPAADLRAGVLPRVEVSPPGRWLIGQALSWSPCVTVL